jgi:hypothetical protein
MRLLWRCCGKAGEAAAGYWLGWGTMPDQHSSITDFAAPANVGASRDPNGADASFNENR